MTRRVGRYTKYETAELLRMFDEGTLVSLEYAAETLVWHDNGKKIKRRF